MADEKAEIGSAMEEVIKAMERLKGRMELAEKRMGVLELFKKGYDERLNNMEEFLKTKFLDAQKNLSELSELLAKSDGEAPASVEGSPAGD